MSVLWVVPPPIFRWRHPILRLRCASSMLCSVTWINYNLFHRRNMFNCNTAMWTAVMTILVPPDKSPLKGPKRNHFSPRKDLKGTKLFQEKGLPENKYLLSPITDDLKCSRMAYNFYCFFYNLRHGWRKFGIWLSEMLQNGLIIRT